MAFDYKNLNVWTVPDSVFLLTLMICWIPSMDVSTLLRLIYSPGIIRFWWQRRIAIKWYFSHIGADIMPLGFKNSPATF